MVGQVERDDWAAGNALVREALLLEEIRVTKDAVLCNIQKFLKTTPLWPV